MYIEDIGEIELIKKISNLAGVQNKDIIVPIGDDAAVVNIPSDYNTVLTTDILIEGVHFELTKISAYQLGRKSMLVNISDIAAMSAMPAYALISMGVMPKTEVEFIEEIYRGMLNVAKEYNFSIVGGDTALSPHSLIINVAMVGKVESNFATKRSDAKVGDKILVTGSLGASSAGLFLLSYKSAITDNNLISALLEPTPRLKEARIAKTCGAHAIEDVSDGLAGEIRHICDASKVGAAIYEKSLPIPETVEEVASIAKKAPKDFALYGGEDYEIVLTVSPEDAEEIIRCIESKTGTTVKLIGEVLEKEEGIYLLTKEGSKEPLLEGYEHFKKGCFNWK